MDKKLYYLKSICSDKYDILEAKFFKQKCFNDNTKNQL